MANAYAAVGLAQGLRSGLRRNRDDALEQQDRDRRLALDQRNMQRQDEADQWTREDRSFTRSERVRAMGLRDVQTKQAEDERAATAKRLHNEGMLALTERLLAGGDPDSTIKAFNASEMGSLELPEGTAFDRGKGELIIPDKDGTARRFNAKQLHDDLAAVTGKQPKVAPDFNLSPGERRISGATGKVIAEGAPKPASDSGGFSLVGVRPDGRKVGTVGNSSTLVYADTFEKVDSAGDGGVRPLTATEERLRRNAFRTALDTRTKDQFGIGSTLNGQDKQRYGAIADRVLRKYGTATPGEDDLSSVIHSKLSAVPSQRTLRDIEVKRRIDAGEAVRSTGIFGGIDEEGTKKAADETAKIQREALLRKAEDEIEQEIGDIATAFYGYGANPSGAAPAARGSAPTGVDGNPLW